MKNIPSPNLILLDITQRLTHPLLYFLQTVYSYYNVATTMTFNELMNDALIMAKLGGVDVFNALDLGENKTMFEELQFGTLPLN